MENFNLNILDFSFTLLVFIIGWFLKMFYFKFSKFMDITSKSIQDLNINIEKLVLKHDHAYDLIKKNESSIENNSKEIVKLREKYHAIDGTTKSTASYLEAIDNEIKHIKEKVV